MKEETIALKEILRSNIHDLKNYISPIMLYSEFLMEAKDLSEVSENSEIILEKSELLNKHLNALRLLYSDSFFQENESVKDFLANLSLILTPFFRFMAKVCVFRFERHLRFKAKNRLIPDEFFKIFYEAGKTMSGDSLIVAMQSYRNGEGTIILVEKKMDPLEIKEIVKEVSDCELEQIINEGKIFYKMEL